MNSRRFYSNFQKEEKNNPKEKTLQNDNFLNIQLQNEVNIFRKLIIDDEMLEEDCMNTRRFWLKNKSELPYLFILTKKLLNIQASGAFVERFYSICGIICSDKNTNMKDDTIIMRSVLKANIHTLDELAIEEE